MANGTGSGSYEKVLETRHLVGIFFAVVVLCGLFFTLGFVLGRDRAARSGELKPAAEEKPTPPVAEAPAARGDLGFYDRVGKPKPAPTVTPKPAPASKPAASLPAPPAGSAAKPATTTASKATPASTAQAPAESSATPLYLQVAALTQKGDADRLSGELRRLGFPAGILPPKSDRYYRVQVGPFANLELATAAQERLKAHGFKAILRR